MKYVMMFADTPEFEATLAAMDDAERARSTGRVMAWFAEHEDKVTYHERLMPPDSATTIRLDRDEPLVTDGPYVEGKEVVSGIAEVDVADLDEALRMARSWPGCPIVEIRPVMEIPAFG
ncbi:YciI family protein [Paractinoplanes globisporus]|uniref:YciI family protein n=1 Tax=Paractinoplanes globisporus TaxID=113565 RepID=A0ABW6WS43_9ACTN|nr:YciI family protein [Actinoplanes globisporus]